MILCTNHQLTTYPPPPHQTSIHEKNRHSLQVPTYAQHDWALPPSLHTPPDHHPPCSWSGSWDSGTDWGTSSAWPDLLSSTGGDWSWHFYFLINISSLPHFPRNVNLRATVLPSPSISVYYYPTGPILTDQLISTVITSWSIKIPFFIVSC